MVQIEIPKEDLKLILNTIVWYIRDGMGSKQYEDLEKKIRGLL